jgi:hypothetical protein
VAVRAIPAVTAPATAVIKNVLRFMAFLPLGLNLRGRFGILGLSVLDKSSVLILLESGSQLFLGIHDDGAIPGDRFIEWFPRDQQETERLVSRLD